MVETIAFTSAGYPTLTYAHQPFPVVVLDGEPWWSTSHAQHFLGGRFRPETCEHFTDRHVGAHRFPFDDENELSHVISTMAVLEKASRYPDRRRHGMLASWITKRDAELRTAPPLAVGTLFRVRVDGLYPPEPPYAGPLLEEWNYWRAEYEARFGPLRKRLHSLRTYRARPAPFDDGEPPEHRRARLIAEAAEQRRQSLAVRDAR